MAVIVRYMSDRDTNKQFTSKKEADEYDKKLELGSALGVFLSGKIDELTDELGEEIGILLAENRDLLVSAFKKPSVLLESNDESSINTKADGQVSPVTDISAAS